MGKSRVTAGLQTIPRLSGVMLRKDQHAQTLYHQRDILATLGHTKHVQLPHRHNVHQEVEISPLQALTDIPIMEHLVAMVVIRHIVLVDYIPLNSLRDSFLLHLDLQVVHLQDMGLEYPPALAVALKQLDLRCRMEALDHQGKMEALDHQEIMEALDHQGKTEALDPQGKMDMEALDHLVKMEALDHLGIMEALDHQEIMEALDPQGKMRNLDHLG